MKQRPAEQLRAMLQNIFMNIDLGIVSYDEGLFHQQQIHDDRVRGIIGDTVILLEHEAVITIGMSGGKEDLLVPEEDIAARNIDIRKAGRGGKLTCHYPGQLVVYPIMNFSEYVNDIHAFVHNLEEVIVRTLADFGVVGERKSGLRGVFVGNNKIAAIGIGVRKSVTMHGFSVNIFADRNLYSLFIPCGITDNGIAFLEYCVEPGTKLTMKKIKEMVLYHFSNVFRKSGK